MNERMKFTDLEKQVMSDHPEALNIMYMGKDINEAIKNDATRKFNEEQAKFEEEMDARNKKVEEIQDSINCDINKAEIKPLYARVLLKPFEHNPFQKMTVENGLIVDAGGYTPHMQINPNTGKYEEQEQFILTGVVVEVGPECKYLQEGDVVYYRKDSVMPVPFFRQNLVTLSENQILCCINENLQQRFDKVK